ncbi:hypothetical protein [Tabrizicola sp.]|uniref:hypothetical protein n=1 Tax=Tabrizicola sp. TaxID=2005166 RepID=UPI00260F73E8|nr:hypothetical protein [Tabrizicola sp.]MDM7930935.1 hypothetical protein [Tabrizicola sp.]
MTQVRSTTIGQPGDHDPRGLILQDQGLQRLLAEMQALVALMPGRHSATPQMTGTDCRSTDETESQTDAMIEAGFDNMPV